MSHRQRKSRGHVGGRQIAVVAVSALALSALRQQETPDLHLGWSGVFHGSPDGIRTRATALRGRRARPLHNGAMGGGLATG